MQALSEIQSSFRDAVVHGNGQGVLQALKGGRYPERRLVIHQRNYRSSLTDAVLTKFPATHWLLGTQFITEVVQRFIGEFPPQAPCIAEYGVNFPDFLGGCAPHLPYIREFARLEWTVGKAAIAVDEPPLDPSVFSAIAAELLPDKFLTLQTGVHYLQTCWRVDELMTVYLADNAPDQFELTPADVWIEVRGARGEFQINRLDAEVFTFRKSLLEGLSIGDAAERALDVSATFNSGYALASLLTAGLVTEMRGTPQNNEGNNNENF
jgi:hypothetical protein